MANSVNDEDESEKFEVTHHSLMAPPNLEGDWMNFFLLIVLYTMQGMTLGVAIAIPFIFQAKKDVSYGDQVKTRLKYYHNEEILDTWYKSTT